MPLLVAVLLGAALSLPVRAQDDPPGRVAQLNFMQGTVSFRPAQGTDDDWVTAVPNRPLTIGDRLWTDNDGRAELHVGSTAIRMDANTGISFLNLNDNAVQLQVSSGAVIVRLRRLDPNDSFEVDAPNLAFSLLAPGNYRVDVDPDNAITKVTVVEGQGEVTGGGRTYNLTADQRATFTGTDTLDYDLADADVTPPTDFDQWAADRDHSEDNSQSARYVSPEVTGSGELDANGDWRDMPGYGNVWVPRGVAVGWAPYRFGHWIWVAPWGWTWVEDESWGFAPFHYGRWVYGAGYWGWVPGPVAARPVYAPALVAWVGGGPGFSFSASFGVGGGVAWFPLGPREVFVPSYRVSDTYVTRVNISNTVVERTTVVNVYHNTNVTNITYVNQHVAGGVTAVSHDTFVNARPVSRNIVTGQERELAAAPVARNLAVEPVHASVVGAGRPVASRPPAAVFNRTVVAKRTPPPQPVRFAAQPGGQPGGRAFQPSQPVPSYRPPNRQNDQGANVPVRSEGNNPGANNPGRNNPEENNPEPRAAFAGSAPANPNVRQAPPPREATPAEQQQDTEKQRGWQQQHEQAHPGNRKNDQKSSKDNKDK